MPAGVDGISRNPTRVVRSSLIVTVSSIMPSSTVKLCFKRIFLTLL